MQNFEHSFFGRCTVGQKGQVVIPVKARKKMSLNNDDELVVFGNKKILHMIKASELGSILKSLREKFDLEASKGERVAKQGNKNAK